MPSKIIRKKYLKQLSVIIVLICAILSVTINAETAEDLYIIME